MENKKKRNLSDFVEIIGGDNTLNKAITEKIINHFQEPSCAKKQDDISHSDKIEQIDDLLENVKELYWIIADNAYLCKKDILITQEPLSSTENNTEFFKRKLNIVFKDLLKLQEC